jgi:transposase
LFPRCGSSRRKRRRGGGEENGRGEERTMARLTKKKIEIQLILKNEWSKTCGISKFFSGD